MDLQKEGQQRSEFKRLLFDLAQDQELPNVPYRKVDFYKRLENLYCPQDGTSGFRHFYSDIFSSLSEIQGEESAGSIDVLVQNLDELRRGYQVKNSTKTGELIDATKSINKLYDHVNLEYARLRQLEAGEYSISSDGAIVELRTQIKDLSGQVVSAKNDVTAVNETIKSAQKEYITILGIFAAILLAFVGGITFSTSVLENIGKIDTYRILLIALVLGLVLVNVLYGLFYYIYRIARNEKEIRVYPMLIANVVFILLMASVVFAWFNGTIERRDERILHSSNVQGFVDTNSDSPESTN